MIRPFISLGPILVATQIALRANAAQGAPFTASLLENDVLRLRVQHLTGNFAQQLIAAQPTNKLGGLILDLRSADGDKGAAPAPGGLMADKGFPLIILVDGQTRGAAAVWAADLRRAGSGILVGSTNFTGPVRPDITVTVSVADEIKFLADPFYNPAPQKISTPSATNEFLPFVDHTSEADLVRQRVKDGEEDGSQTPRTTPVQPVIRDPALARAVDLVKALTALKQPRG